MKRRERKVEEFVLRHVGLYKASPEEMDLAQERIQKKLRSDASQATDREWDESLYRGRTRRPLKVALVFGAVAAVIVLGVFLRKPVPQQIPQIDAHVVVVSADGSLSRVSGATVENVHNGERIEAGERLRTNDSNGSITLADGSRVETRSHSEFTVERAEDGVRIHLYRGGLIVKATRQATGHLYVQTKDVNVSVVGTVFLVNAEEEGSRVAVVEGEVRVQHGATTKNLLPGDQLSTNPKLAPLSVKTELAWSGEAEFRVSVPEQSSVKPKEDRVAFELASIRPGVAPPSGGRGAPSELNQSLMMVCGGPGSQLDDNPERFVLRNATVYRLIVLAYGLKDCGLALQMGLVAGGPEWVRSDRFDIQAMIPEGSPAYTRQQLSDGEAPRLQKMIQNLLAERFKLSVRRETKDVAAYNLVVAKAGKGKLSEDQSAPSPLIPGQGFRAGATPRGAMLNCAGMAISISGLANCFQKSAGGPIIDKTDLKGLYDIPQVTNTDPSAPMSEAFRLSQTLEQLGLKLEATKVSKESLIIERVEKPTEN